KRSWLMVLFTLALVMVLGVLPYQAFLGEFKFGYLAWGLFCLGAGRYAYVRLYHPETVAEEKREESNRQRREAAPRKKRRKLDGLYFSAHGLYQLQQ
ncbi:MAG: hypothetical protein ACREUI_11495, partial [Burkholderiales bacterium]